jgi:pimeloyl-ACP methyl ester carboxylesterase
MQSAASSEECHVTTWLDTSFEMRFRVIDGLTVRFAVSDHCGDHDALLLSPWPESLLAFEPTWWRLAEHAHLVAIDLPGFGHSERRDTLLSRGRWVSSSSPPPTRSGSSIPT